MNPIKTQVVHGATIQMFQEGEKFTMISPITGIHSVVGTKERALCHWYGFIANNKDVPVPLAVYQKNGQKEFFYACNADRNWLIRTPKPILNKHDLSPQKMPVDCLYRRKSITELDAIYTAEGFTRIPDNQIFN